MRPTFLILIVLILLVSPVLAHKVNIFAYLDGGTVYCEGYYPDGRPVVAGTLQVYEGEKLLLEGTTDSAGFFQFPLPAAAEVKIVLDAGMGHRNQFLLKTAVKE